MVNTLTIRDIGSDRQLINEHLETLLHQQRSREAGSVHEAMCYSVLGSAQRIRPVLTLQTARMVGTESAGVLRAAASVELFHCASLIIDDLPCMDNASTRRAAPAVHIRYGEATAILAAFGLVALAARSLVDNTQASNDDRGRLCQFQLHLLKALDCSALIAGQALDLRLMGDPREQQRTRVTELKTVPLFQLAVQAGALFADLSPAESNALRKFAVAFGTAFQAADDYLDGESFDTHALDEQLTAARDCLSIFGESSVELEGLLSYLHARAQRHEETNRRYW